MMSNPSFLYDGDDAMMILWPRCPTRKVWDRLLETSAVASSTKILDVMALKYDGKLVYWS